MQIQVLIHKIISGAVNRKTICWWPSWEASSNPTPPYPHSPLPGTGQDGGYVAARPELWHICVFIEAQGMELGKLGGGGVGVSECVCMHPWDWGLCVCVERGGSQWDLHVTCLLMLLCLCVCVCVCSFWAKGRESRDKRGESAAGEEREKKGGRAGGVEGGCGSQIRLYLQISCQKEPFKGNVPVPAPWQARCLFCKKKTKEEKKKQKKDNYEAEREIVKRRAFSVEDRHSKGGGGIVGEGSEWVLSDFICSLFKVCFTCPCAAPPTSNTGAAF